MLGRRGIGLGGAAALAAAAAAGAQGGAAGTWPERPLRWIVGYPPGGASDTFARLIGAHMAGTRLGQNVVVENRPGGGAVVAQRGRRPQRRRMAIP